MTSAEIIQTLEAIARLMELTGANPFKSRAYERGARALAGQPTDISQLVRDGRLSEIDGIGKGLTAELTEMVRTGHSATLDALHRQVPPGLVELTEIPGLGLKKARLVHDTLSVSSPTELEYACIENRLVGLPGFGEKTQAKILAALQFRKTTAGFVLLSEGDRRMAALLDLVRALPGVERAEGAGPWRRRVETLDRLDVVVQTADAAALFGALSLLPGMADVSERTADRLTLTLADSALPLTVHTTTADRFGTVWALATGAKAHLDAIRPRPDIPWPDAADEPAFYGVYSLPVIEPELREGELDEVIRALDGTLPELVTEADLRGVLHVHSTYSDGRDTLREMAEAAIRSKLEYLGITDHSRVAAYAGGLSVERVREQHDEIDRLNAEFAGRLTLFKGTECDILADGSLDYPDDVLASFDFVIGSIHSRFNMTEREATDRLIRAMDNPFLTILGHPTGRLLLGRPGYPVDHDRLIRAAAERGVAIEVNANPHRLDIDWRWLPMMQALGVPTAPNPDAHRIEGLADVRFGVSMLRKGGLTAADVLTTRSAADLAAFFNRRKP